MPLNLMEATLNDIPMVPGYTSRGARLLQSATAQARRDDPSADIPFVADAVNDGYWQRFFDGCEVYQGWRIKCDSGRWWSWDGWTIGNSLSEADCRRAADLFPGRLR